MTTMMTKVARRGRATGDSECDRLPVFAALPGPAGLSGVVPPELEVLRVERPLAADEPALGTSQDIRDDTIGMHGGCVPLTGNQEGIPERELGPEPCLSPPCHLILPESRAPVRCGLPGLQPASGDCWAV